MNSCLLDTEMIIMSGRSHVDIYAGNFSCLPRSAASGKEASFCSRL